MPSGSPAEAQVAFGPSTQRGHPEPLSLGEHDIGPILNEGQEGHVWYFWLRARTGENPVLVVREGWIVDQAPSSAIPPPLLLGKKAIDSVLERILS